MAKLVSQTYGDALFLVAVEEGRIDEFFGEVQTLLELFRTNDKVNKLMEHPQIKKEEKLNIVERIFAGNCSKELVGLLRLLIQKGHYKDIMPVFSYFISLVKEEKKIGTAEITLADIASEKQCSAIESKLLEITKYESFEINYKVDKALIGGIIIRIGDRVVDSSIRTKIYELSKELRRIQV